MTKLTIPIRAIWNEPAQKWLLQFDEGFDSRYVGKFFLDVWDCGTVNLALQRPDKTKVNRYRLTIEKIE